MGILASVRRGPAMVIGAAVAIGLAVTLVGSAAAAADGVAPPRSTINGPSCGGGSHSVPDPIGGGATTYWAMGQYVEGSGQTARTYSYWLVERSATGGAPFLYSKGVLVSCGRGLPVYTDLVAISSTGQNVCTQAGDFGVVEGGVSKSYVLVGERASRTGPNIWDIAKFRFWHVRKATPGWQFDRAFLARCPHVLIPGN